MGMNISFMNQSGGLPTYQETAKRLSDKVYAVIDKSDGFYFNRVDKAYRSRINVTLCLANAGL